MINTDSNRVLKAKDVRGFGTKVAFNYEDLKRRCDEYVENVRRQTGQMIKDACNEAESIRRQAYQEAKTAGLREAEKEADAEIEKRANLGAEQKAAEMLGTVLPAMQQTSDALVREYDRWLANWHTAALRVGVAIAEKLIRHRITVQPEIATEMISQALQLAAGNAHLELRLNPRDLEMLGDHAQQVVQSLSACNQARLSPDDSIEPGGCIIETQHGQIDARLETMLERIASELIQGT